MLWLLLLLTLTVIVRLIRLHVAGILYSSASSVIHSCASQMEVVHIASLHLRARRISDSKFVAAALVRAMSRFYALITGRRQGASPVPNVRCSS